MKTKIISLVILVILISLPFAPIFKISTVNVKNPTNCLNNNSQQLQEFKNKNIISFNTKNAEKTIGENLNCINNLHIKKIYPNKLELSTEVEMPIAKIANTDLAITESGEVTKESPSAPAPILFVPEGTNVSQNQKITNTQILYALKIAKELIKSDFVPASIRTLDAGDIAVYSNQEAVALFSSFKDAGQQVDSLQAVIAKAKINSTKIAKIDLRFDKPTITNK